MGGGGVEDICEGKNGVEGTEFACFCVDVVVFSTMAVDVFATGRLIALLTSARVVDGGGGAAGDGFFIPSKCFMPHFCC